MSAESPGRNQDVVELSRWRAALARARKGHRAEALVAEDDAAALVAAMPVQEIYYAIEEVGLDDAHDLLALCSIEQVKGLVDLDVWEKDQIVPLRLGRWLEAVQDLDQEEPIERFGQVVDGLDPEVIALYLQSHATIYDLELDLPPEEPEGHFVTTPDTFFLLDVTAGGEAGKRFDGFIEWLYRADLDMARRLLMAARSETPSELEEYAYRWRSGRMADLGYAEFYDALSVYRLLDPASVRIDENTADRSRPAASLPAELLSPIDERGFFSRALGQISDEETLERLRGHLMTLANRVMAAELVRPGDLPAAQATLGRTLGYLNIGLETLTKGDLALARSALAHVALERLFRLGFTLTRQLSALTNALYTKGGIRLPDGAGALLLDGPFDKLIEALHRARPLYVEVSAEAIAPSEAKPARTFAALAEIGRAALALEEATHAPATLARLGADFTTIQAAVALTANPPSLVRFSALAQTLGARLLLDGPAATLGPLSAAELQKLGPVAVQLPAVANALRARLSSVGNPETGGEVEGKKMAAERFIARWTQQPADLLVTAVGVGTA